MKKSKGHSAPCGKTESPAKAKSRIKRFEQHLECNHRLANTYANNQPGEVPSVPKAALMGALLAASRTSPVPSSGTFPKMRISRSEAAEVGKVMDVAGAKKRVADSRTVYPEQGGPPKKERRGGGPE